MSQLPPALHEQFDAIWRDTLSLKWCEFYVSVGCREEHLGLAEATLAKAFGELVGGYMSTGTGPTYIRIAPEYEVQEDRRIFCLHPEGPEKDFYTDKRFIPVPGKYLRAKAYARLWREGGAVPQVLGASSERPSRVYLDIEVDCGGNLIVLAGEQYRSPVISL